MVFGHSRQEDLVAFLLAQLDVGTAAHVTATLRIDLLPPSN